MFAYIVPGHGSSLLEPEFECVPMSFGERGDETFADQIEATIRSVAPDLICLDLSSAPWLCLVRFPEIPKAYITNYFLTTLTPENTSQTIYLRKNFGHLTQRRIDRGLPAI